MPRKKTDEAVNVTELDEINQEEETKDIIPDETEEAEPEYSSETAVLKPVSYTHLTLPTKRT